MHGESFFVQAFIYLAAAVISVPIAKRLGLGSVLGYLLAGIAIGPFVLGLVGEEGKDVMHFAEFGVVMMLFLVGLELEPALLWRLRWPILGLGGLQVVATATVFLGIAALVVGVAVPEALAIGMTLALSSTAIALQSLNEKGLMKTTAGQSSFAVLLFQDIAVIPMLALFPLLATYEIATTADDGHHTTWVQGLPAWQQTLAVLAVVAGIVVAGRFAVRPVFRAVAGTRLRELFVAMALLLVITIALVMTKVGLSPALGTFIAGVVLAGSEYRHELESDIEPFKGLLLGLFFISVGASIDFHTVAGRPAAIAALVGAVFVVKLGVLAALGKVFKLGFDQTVIFALSLWQIGEFGFVLLSFSSQNGVVASATAALLNAVVAITMALTPLLALVGDKLILPRIGTTKKAARPTDEIDAEGAVIIAGYGRFGQIVGRLLAANGIGCTVLEHDSDQVDLLRKLGRRVYYGDASRTDLLHAAGAERAKVLVIAIESIEKRRAMVHEVKKHFPHLKILCRAFDRSDAYELIEAGVDGVHRETFGTAVDVGTDALRKLGFRAHRAHRAGLVFRRHDEMFMHEMAHAESRKKDWMAAVRERLGEVERVLAQDMRDRSVHVQKGWEIESLRRELREKDTRPATGESPKK